MRIDNREIKEISSIVQSTAQPVHTVTTNPPPKRRGRPPKNANKPIESTLESTTNTISIVTNLLSLKERLALKGRNAKIVAKHKATAPSPARSSSASATLLKPSQSILKTGSGVNSVSPGSPTTAAPIWSKFGGEDGHDYNNTLNDNDAHKATVDPSPARGDRTFSSPPPKGPTIVRLMSPTPDKSDEDDGNSPRSRSYSTSSDDGSSSDVSIPAVNPSTISKRGGASARGYGGMRGAMRASRGRGRPRGSKNRL